MARVSRAALVFAEGILWRSGFANSLKLFGSAGARLFEVKIRTRENVGIRQHLAGRCARGGEVTVENKL